VFASSVASATPSARLVYSRSADAASCPDEAALRRAVASRVGYDAFFPWAQRTIVAAIVRREGSFVATVDLVDEGGIDHGAHELHTDGACVDLLDAVALALAIAIDPHSALATPAARVQTAPPPEAPPPETPPPISLPTFAPPDSKPQSPEPPPHAAPRDRQKTPALALEASAGVVASVNMAPSVSFGGTLGTALRASWFSIGLEGQFDAPASGSALGTPKVTTWAAIAAVLPCAHVGPAFVCAVGQAGTLQSSADSVQGSHSSSTVWGAAGGRVGVVLPVTNQLSVRVRADVLRDLSPTTLTVAGTFPWTASAVAGSLGIDGVVRF